MRNPLIIIAIVALTLLAGCAPLVAQRGDTVLVNYVGTFENGSVFDTNIAAVAQRIGTYSFSTSYAPLNITLGNGDVIPGFEQALYGMRKGESKHVIVTPDQGYGNYSIGKTAEIPLDNEVDRVVTAERTVIVPTNVLRQEHPDAQEGQSFQNGGTNYTIMSIGPANTTLFLEAAPGDLLRVGGTSWNSTVLNVTAREVIVRQDPVNGTTITTALGPVQVTVEPTKLSLHLFLGVGDSWQAGPLNGYRVTMLNATYATVDANHPLAGKTLIFNLTVVDVQRPKAS
jgi:FKBP-type peptidyl-prolyl cis-trans isomerase 2